MTLKTRPSVNSATTIVDHHDVHQGIYNVEPMSLAPLPNEKVCDNRHNAYVAEFLAETKVDDPKRKSSVRKLSSFSTNLWANSFFKVSGKSSKRRSSSSTSRRHKRKSLPKFGSKSDIFDLAVEKIHSNRKIAKKLKQMEEILENKNRLENRSLRSTSELETNFSIKNSTENPCPREKLSPSKCLDNVSWDSLPAKNLKHDWEGFGELNRLKNNNVNSIAEPETSLITKESTDCPCPRDKSTLSKCLSVLQDPQPITKKRKNVLISKILSAMEKSEETRAKVKKMNLKKLPESHSNKGL